MITRRTFAIAVRLIAVAAAIYTFFAFRSQLADRKPPSDGSIPVRVIGAAPPCGYLSVEKADGAKSDVSEGSAIIREALTKPGHRVEVRNQKECERLLNLDGEVVVIEQQGTFRIDFRKAP